MDKFWALALAVHAAGITRDKSQEAKGNYYEYCVINFTAHDLRISRIALTKFSAVTMASEASLEETIPAIS